MPLSYIEIITVVGGQRYGRVAIYTGDPREYDRLVEAHRRHIERDRCPPSGSPNL